MRYSKYKIKGVIGIFTLALAMVMAVSCTCDTQFSSEKFEEAAQVYEIEAESPTVLGDLVKISEADFNGGLEDIGADGGRILEYSNDTDYVVVMIFSFVSEDVARESFEELEEGTEIAWDLYEVEEGLYRYIYGDDIYLASGSADAVFTVLEGLVYGSNPELMGSTPSASGI